MQKKKEKEDRKRDIFLIILCILILMIGIGIFIIVKEPFIKYSLFADRDVSATQSDINVDLDHKNNETAYTELMGFGRLELDYDYPNVYLINPSDNDVYLSFDVMNNDEIIYQSGLIEPGKMEEFDAYSCLNAGEHTLVYSISSYDLESKAVLWSGIRQNQEILIRK